MARETTGLPRDAAAWVDRQVAPVAHSISYGRLMKLIDLALLQHDPVAADRQRDAAREARRVLLGDPNTHGVVTLWAELDAPDAAALDDTLNRGAEALAALGDESHRDVRRSRALGMLADPQAALDLLAGSEPRRRTDLVLHVHVDEAALVGDRGTAQTPDLRGLPLQTLRDWCSDPATQIVVKPVVDCGVELAAPGYRPTAPLREQAMLRDLGCVFPWCDRTGTQHDLDHIEPYAPGDRTRSSNLARLCRYHHRVKTHGRWRYRRLPDGGCLWTNAFGYRWVVRPSGTTPGEPEPGKP